jgi:hypothetical protein
MKITDEIFQVGGSGYTDSADADIYLIHSGLPTLFANAPDT